MVLNPSNPVDWMSCAGVVHGVSPHVGPYHLAYRVALYLYQHGSSQQLPDATGSPQRFRNLAAGGSGNISWQALRVVNAAAAALLLNLQI